MNWSICRSWVAELLMTSVSVLRPWIEPYSLLSVVVMVSPSASVLMVFTRLVPLVTWKSTCVMVAPLAVIMMLLSPSRRNMPSASALSASTLMAPLSTTSCVAATSMLSCATTNSIMPPALCEKYSLR